MDLEWFSSSLSAKPVYTSYVWMWISKYTLPVCNFQMLHLDCTCTNDLCQFRCFELCRIVLTLFWKKPSDVEQFWHMLNIFRKLLKIYDLMLNTRIILLRMLKSMNILFNSFKSSMKHLIQALKISTSVENNRRLFKINRTIPALWSYQEVSIKDFSVLWNIPAWKIPRIALFLCSYGL